MTTSLPAKYRFPEPVVQWFTQQLADGVNFLHSRDIVHRDLKPDNLLLDRQADDARLVISDLGFAKEVPFFFSYLLFSGSLVILKKYLDPMELPDDDG